MEKYSNIFLSFFLLIFVFLAGCSKEEENKEIGLEEDKEIVEDTVEDNEIIEDSEIVENTIKEENSCLMEGIDTKEETTENKVETAEQKVLNLNLDTGIGSLHPIFVDDVYEKWILQHMFEGLYKKDAEGNIIPAVAKDHKVSEDGLTWTFYLNNDRKWSNGAPVTAHDFEYGWKSVIKEVPSSLNYIANAQEYNKGQVTEDEIGIMAVDDCTLEVKLAYSMPDFLDYTALYVEFYPINKKIEEANKKWAENPETYVSNGAFTLSEITQDGIKLQRNEYYYEADKINR